MKKVLANVGNGIVKVGQKVVDSSKQKIDKFNKEIDQYYEKYEDESTYRLNGIFHKSQTKLSAKWAIKKIMAERNYKYDKEIREWMPK